MEAAKILGHIEVTATKEEWGQVIDQLLKHTPSINEASDSLVNWLVYQGVYDQDSA